MKSRINIVNHAINFDYGIINDVYENTHGLYDEVHLMPDTHRGADVPVGFVAKVDIEKGVIPNIVGVDIGCGMSVYELPKLDIENIDWEGFYNHIRKNIPSGSKIHEKTQKFDFENLIMRKSNDKMNLYLKSLGTLGGGNHFIEINSGKNNDYMVVHSGSRKFGLDICRYYNDLREFDLDSYRNELKNIDSNDENNLKMSIKEEYNKAAHILRGEKAQNYLNDMKIAQRFASENRKRMITEMLKFFGYSFDENNFWESVHNYIDFADMTVRKGATPARKGQKIIVPINMKNGSIIALGKGNENWLQSAPHGAGRIMSRSQAKESISIQEYKESMKGVKSFTVTENTLDEAPQAYRNIDEIIEATKDTMEIVEIIKPIFNFKGSQ